MLNEMIKELASKSNDWTEKDRVKIIYSDGYEMVGKLYVYDGDINRIGLVKTSRSLKAYAVFSRSHEIVDVIVMSK